MWIKYIVCMWDDDDICDTSYIKIYMTYAKVETTQLSPTIK